MLGTRGTFASPERISTHFHLHEGDVVADLGAGSGQYMKLLSDAVGKSGRVYLCEIQKQLVESLGQNSQNQRLSNVRTLWCDIEAPGGIKLNDGALDVALLSNILFQFEDKDAALTEISRVLRKGGRLFVIDWTDSFGGLGPHPNHVVTEASARTLFEGAGFSLDRDFPAGEHHYGLAFRKI
jgi:ubiquinone/menaquinone biosynthesis C-methylase UbiE